MKIEALKVELTTLNVQPGDAVLVRATRTLNSKAEFDALVGWAKLVEEIVGCPVIVGACDVEVSVLRKGESDDTQVAAPRNAAAK